MGAPLRIAGVECEDGTRYQADAVMLAAGALHSPRLLQSVSGTTGLESELPAARSVGRNYKFHVLTALLAFSHRPMTDVLSKTMLMTHEAFPHSTLQTLGGSLARDIMLTQAPGIRAAGAGASVRQSRASVCSCRPRTARIRDNRVLQAGGWPPRPQIDHDPRAHSRAAYASIGAWCRRCASSCCSSGYLPVTKCHPADRHCARVRHAGRWQ